MTTTVTIGYDCANECTFTLPTTIRGDQLALAQPALIDTLAVLVDAQHDRDCPDLRLANKEGS